MGLPQGGSKTFQPTPPEKGSFPLDHAGECKQEMEAFMVCLKQHSGQGNKCKELSKQYLQCRMDKELMAKEDMKKLGFKE
eukprot:m.28446 g.28446  ORF g.28446 m.28446 type:complete len:80 (-) comp9040_c0_seq3:698-937(-)